MSWLTFQNGGTVVNKGPVDTKLDRPLSHRQPKIRISTRQSKDDWKPLRLSPSLQNRNITLILRVRRCCLPCYSRVTMKRLFISTQQVDRLFEFLVGLVRCLHSRLSSRLQRIINDLIYPFKTAEQGKG
jgi:hypothetical protein